MGKATWVFLSCLLLFGLYSCHYVLRGGRSAAPELLLTTPFRPGGPDLRIRLSVDDGAILEARDTVTVTPVGSSEQPGELAPRSEPLTFTEGKAGWGAAEFTGRVRLSSAGADLRINDHPYGGVIELVPQQKLVINEIDCEDYLLGVVGKECYPSFEYAALRAQAIASRTYALYNRLFRRNREYHLKDTVYSQVYGGSGNVPDRVRRAVAETCGLVLSYQGRIFQAYCHSTCGGNTTAAAKYLREPDLPPLRGVSCPYCQNSPKYAWIAEYREKRLRQSLADYPAIRDALAKHGMKLGRITALEPILTEHDIYPEYFRVVHTEGSLEVHAPTLQNVCNGLTETKTFLSVAVTACTPNKELLTVEGHGSGHGLGLCQYGAQGQALRGRNYLSILTHYYPGASLMRAWEPDPADGS